MKQLINILFKQNWFLNYQYYVNQISIVHVTGFCESCNINMRSRNLRRNYWNLFSISSKRTFFVFVPDDTINYGITCDQFWVHELYFEFLFLPSSSQYDRAACQAFVIKLKETINYKILQLGWSSLQNNSIQSSSTREHQGVIKHLLLWKLNIIYILHSTPAITCYNGAMML